MGAVLIDGKREAEALVGRVRAGSEAFAAGNGGEAPCLAVVLVGADPASEIYVRTKSRRAAEAGIRSLQHRLPAETTEAELLAVIDGLNRDEGVHGILVQLPLPPHIAADRILSALSPAKDVDGFHPENAGLLATGRPALVPCTPWSCLHLARGVHGSSLRGLEAVMVGRSTIVGRPAAQLFLMADCTVTIAHSATRDLPAACRRADILVVAVGRPEMVRGDWVKPGATVIDVGINRVAAGEGGASRIVGDVAFDEAAEIAGAITPVPGGVGPMTVATLLRNTLACARLQRGGTLEGEV